MAAEVRVLAPNAAKESVTEAISVFEKATGHKVVIAWSGTEAITKRIAEGEVVDVVVNAAQNIDRQSKDGKLAAATRTDFARSGIGVAVPASAAKVDVSTSDALKAALLSARTIVVSSGTSDPQYAPAKLKMPPHFAHSIPPLSYSRSVANKLIAGVFRAKRLFWK